MRISDWSSDVCSSDLCLLGELIHHLADLGRHGIDRELEREAERVVRGRLQHGDDLGGVDEGKTSAEQIDAAAAGAGAGKLQVERLQALLRKTRDRKSTRLNSSN